MTPYLQDPDVTLYHGDVLDVLREMEAESVDCVVTSPPYWGLRDYGTGAWEGGDEGCDHVRPRNEKQLASSGLNLAKDRDKAQSTVGDQHKSYGRVCGKCGATRIDQQIGLEATPEEYVARMVEVFREVRRVLASHGTVWLNLGDSYVSTAPGTRNAPAVITGAGANERAQMRPAVPSGLKPKDLVGIPWRVAFALQADGWYLRSDIIWSKPNPMPESVTDRPTKAHEYVFLLSKQPRYFFDQEAVRESARSNGYEDTALVSNQPGWSGNPNVHGEKGHALPGAWTNGGGRNIRSVWEIATQPYPDAHFATFPEELARRCIAAGCPEQVCRECGKARERVVEKGDLVPSGHSLGARADKVNHNARKQGGIYYKDAPALMRYERTTVGLSDCGCLSERDSDAGRSASHQPSLPRSEKYRPGIVLDPFMGSGTVAHVARKLGRHSIGIDLSADYLALAAKRLQQQSLFALDNGAERSPSAERTEIVEISA